MKIIILGSGNTAAVLGRKFKAAGHEIMQIYSRNAAAASELAYEWDSESTGYKSMIQKNADVYLFAVSDSAIAEVADNLHLPGKVVAHTAASVPAAVLEHVSEHYGVLYPLQSLRKEMTALPEVPVFFDGNNEKAKRVLAQLAQSIAPQQAAQASDDERMKLHVAAVVVSNFTNHLYALAEEYCKKEGLDFKQLLPLIEETAERIKTESPAAVQTGPATRHDKETIHKHLELLKGYPQLRNLYILLSESIGNFKG
jgi:predicted short-subunit dehydrogenase-like oxidoreductase (DUF2520 family)